jgi:hypothetical protein
MSNKFGYVFTIACALRKLDIFGGGEGAPQTSSSATSRAVESRCLLNTIFPGLHQLTMNSQTTSVTRLRTH